MKALALLSSLILGLSLLLAPIAAGASSERAGQTQPAHASGETGVLFVENVGQFAEGARFRARAPRGLAGD